MLQLLNSVSALSYLLVLLHVPYLELSLNIELEGLNEVLFDSWSLRLSAWFFIVGRIFGRRSFSVFRFLFTGRGLLALLGILLREVLLVIVQLRLYLVLDVVKVQLVVPLLVRVLRNLYIDLVGLVHFYGNVNYSL